MTELPVTVCWHCDRRLDAASGITDDGQPDLGSISLCLYCGVIALFGPDLRLVPPTDGLLDELAKDHAFRTSFVQFSWARQYVMLQDLLRDREDPMTDTPLPLIGRERFMIERLAKVLHTEARRHWDYGQLWEVARGNTFEVLMPDGRVAKVSVTLDRVIPAEQR